MKRTIYILMCSCCFFLSACVNVLENSALDAKNAATKADNLETVEVTLETAGTLAERLGTKAGTTQKLILSGPVDADDINTLRGMPLLESLDIKGVEFVESEKTYTTVWGGRSVVKKGIGQAMFSRLPLKQIVLPENIEIIREQAFAESKIESVNLPESLLKIEYAAFEATMLTDVVIPSKIKEIPQEAFESCGSLRSVVLPEGIISIGASAFHGCASLPAINLPETVTSFGSGAFGGSGLSSITIPEGVTVISGGCFSYCGALQVVNLPSHLTVIEGAAFDCCTSLKSIDIPNTVTEIKHQAFLKSGIQSIKLPDNITTIHGLTFYGCSSLEEIQLPANLKVIGSDAFQDCTSLRFLDVPSTVELIDDGALKGTKGLCAIFLNGKTTLGDLFYDTYNCLIYLPASDANVSPKLKNIIINGVASSIVLRDNGSDFFCPREFKTQKISYTKAFNSSSAQYPIPGKAAGWVGLSLPFTVSNMTLEDGRVLAPFNANIADAKPFWLRKLTANGFENATSIEAGIPYIVAMPHNEKYAEEYNIKGAVTFTAQDITNGITIPVTSFKKNEGPLFDFHPSYESQPKGVSNYVLNTYDFVDDYNCGSVFVRALRDSKPFESYVTDKAISTKSPAMFSIGGTAQTRSSPVVGGKPSIDDM